MKNINLYFITIFLAINGFAAYSQEEISENRHETGLYYAIGTSFDWGNSATTYSKNKYNNIAEVGTYYKSSFINSKLKIKTEFSFRFLNSDYKFANDIKGIVNQKNIGLNLKLGKTFVSSNANEFDIYMGYGIYTLAQKRIADPAFSNQKTIDDGFAAYWGMSVEMELAGSIPLKKGRMGIATRIFVQPPFTIASKTNVPKFYHQGFSIAWFVSF